MSGPINGVVELSAKLTGSPQAVGDCVALQWFRSGNGRLEGQEDGCSIDSIRQQFRASNYDMRRCRPLS